ncbi:hypothetical protein [Niabella ginsengisoli]|uniref:Addiction module protein n=1 Tax=Niabella ginsengisoli TaxID=522298 RepID=A0ABS9SPS4_9BACT|nr:hypothetical protein [Niabella ginsengisoli]MCH5600266.1 hypothetical protein [Niabella ginsengisoli]
METILIKPKNKEEFDLVSALMKRMNIRSIVQKKPAKLTKKEQEFLDSFPQRFKEMQDDIDGKVKLRSWDEVYKEL